MKITFSHDPEKEIIFRLIDLINILDTLEESVEIILNINSLEVTDDGLLVTWIEPPTQSNNNTLVGAWSLLSDKPIGNIVPRRFVR